LGSEVRLGGAVGTRDLVVVVGGVVVVLYH